MTIKLNSAPQMIITIPASKRKMYNSRVASLEVELSSRTEIVNIIDPTAETNTGGAAMRIKVVK